FGGSTNLLLHIPAIAHAAKLPRPTVEDWTRINRETPRLVDVIPNGPVGYGTVQVFLAGGVPEVMLHLRELQLLKLDVQTVNGSTLGESLDVWKKSERRQLLRTRLQELDGIDPNDVIMNPHKARERGLTSAITFLTGNLAPQGAVIKSTAIDPSIVDEDGVYRKTGPARVFTSERAAIAAVKGLSENPIKAGDVIALIGCGPMGTGMEETYQLTSALRYLPEGKTIALITDARFSGVSTGACIGHIGPEALAGGPLGKLRDGDTIQIIVDRVHLSGSIDLVGEGNARFDTVEGARILSARTPHADLKPNPDLPDDTRLWAYLQNLSGGTWGGCVYDVDAIIEHLR
ncbi:MAG: dihydroxy-acid dehydratase, partial [Anaerolineales bacterium]|nr:dihydroxy-acid dehydratase [Anaerolineales bacterium]